jgi:DNA phosphorothioation-dependent restriction protein DptG
MLNFPSTSESGAISSGNCGKSKRFVLWILLHRLAEIEPELKKKKNNSRQKCFINKVYYKTDTITLWYEFIDKKIRLAM